MHCIQAIGYDIQGNKDSIVHSAGAGCMTGYELQDNKDPGVALISRKANGITRLPPLAVDHAAQDATSLS